MTEPAELAVRFNQDGVVPVVAQNAVSGDVLMLAFMNAEALRLTQETGYAHYWSRSRNALWKKGETSGHVQIVDEIRINCERNSLLLVVRQVGAVCHDGYATCFYRRLGPNGSLNVVRERAFDPADVYGARGSVNVDPVAASDDLTKATHRQFGAYAFLRDNPVESLSGTSGRLRTPAMELNARLAGELRELAGVVDGTHRHTEPTSDLCLEASQVIYWLLLCCLRFGVTWDKLRPDLALSQEAVLSDATLPQRLRAEADRWESDQLTVEDLTTRAQHTLALVGQACRDGEVEPLTVIDADLQDLSSRPYLQSYFAQP